MNYYIQIKHRNSIETWSKVTMKFIVFSMTYDFTTSNIRAFGDNMLQIDDSPLRYGIYSGDEDQNGFVELNDVINVNNNVSGFVTGYVNSDMNGDNITDLSDVLITFNNSNLFAEAKYPGVR